MLPLCTGCDCQQPHSSGCPRTSMPNGEFTAIALLTEMPRLTWRWHTCTAKLLSSDCAITYGPTPCGWPLRPLNMCMCGSPVDEQVIAPRHSSMPAHVSQRQSGIAGCNGVGGGEPSATGGSCLASPTHGSSSHVSPTSIMQSLKRDPDGHRASASARSSGQRANGSAGTMPAGVRTIGHSLCVNSVVSAVALNDSTKSYW